MAVISVCAARASPVDARAARVVRLHSMDRGSLRTPAVIQLMRRRTLSDAQSRRGPKCRAGKENAMSMSRRDLLRSAGFAAVGAALPMLGMRGAAAADDIKLGALCELSGPAST